MITQNLVLNFSFSLSHDFPNRSHNYQFLLIEALTSDIFLISLYVNGYNPQLAKLYPEVKFPVSRGTRMISPFIKWNHDRDWFTPSYNLQATTSAQHTARKIKIQISDQQWAFTQGHVIDGK